MKISHTTYVDMKTDGCGYCEYCDGITQFNGVPPHQAQGWPCPTCKRNELVGIETAKEHGIIQVGL